MRWRRAIAGEAPGNERTAANGKGPVAEGDHSAVGQGADFRVVEFAGETSGGKPLRMEPGIDFGGLRRGDAGSFGEGAGVVFRRLTPAVEAGTVAGGERGHLVEEEELAPSCASARSVAAEGIASPAPGMDEIAHDPRLGGPAAPEQRPRVGIMNDAAVSRECAARGDRMDAAERIDAVLQRHQLSSCKADGA